MTVWIGTSGWAYPEWRRAYYPAGVPHRRELEYLADRMSTVEINGSFYSLQQPAGYRSWRDRTPDSFLFAVKGHRFVTHLRQLHEPAGSVANFLASGVLELRAKLGPILWQFPQRLHFDPGLMADFLAALPSDTAAAETLVTGHANRVPDDREPATGQALPLRHAVEIRHPSFVSERFLDLLREHGVASVIADTAGRWPYVEETTAGFTYVRLHGDTELYASRYDPAALRRWAKRVEAWRHTGDVYVYFDNTAQAAAPHNAERLAAMLGVGHTADPISGPGPGRHHRR